MMADDELDDTPESGVQWELLDEFLATPIGSAEAVEALERIGAARRPRAAVLLVCRVCGCTQERACIDRRTGKPCRWVERDLCSSCRFVGSPVKKLRLGLGMNKGVFAAELQISMDRLYTVENNGSQLSDHAAYRLRRLLGDDLSSSPFARGVEDKRKRATAFHRLTESARAVGG